jgi:hypothetical protein
MSDAMLSKSKRQPSDSVRLLRNREKVRENGVDSQGNTPCDSSWFNFCRFVAGSFWRTVLDGFCSMMMALDVVTAIINHQAVSSSSWELQNKSFAGPESRLNPL